MLAPSLISLPDALSAGAILEPAEHAALSKHVVHVAVASAVARSALLAARLNEDGMKVALGADDLRHELLNVLLLVNPDLNVPRWHVGHGALLFLLHS